MGLGKTVEADLAARELLLRRRIDFIVIAAPPAMTIQWKDELEAKFGLSFEIIDAERIGELRRLRLAALERVWRVSGNRMAAVNSSAIS